MHEELMSVRLESRRIGSRIGLSCTLSSDDRATYRVPPEHTSFTNQQAMDRAFRGTDMGIAFAPNFPCESLVSDSDLHALGFNFVR